MEDLIMVNFQKIKSMVLVYFLGKMVENILVIGKMANRMDMENIFLLIMIKKLVYGNKVKEIIG